MLIHERISGNKPYIITLVMNSGKSMSRSTAKAAAMEPIEIMEKAELRYLLFAGHSRENEKDNY